MGNKARADIAKYIAEVATELRELAHYNGLVTISYILDLAILEAEQSVGPPPGDVTKNERAVRV